MLTPYLEELIWCGEAEYRTWTVGTPNPVLRVADDETIIVTDIWYDPFIDSRVRTVLGADWWPRANKMITLSDGKKRYNFLARNFFQPNLGMMADFRHFDTYCVFTSNNLSLFIANFPTVNTPWVYTPGTAPVETKAATRPIGYGNATGGLQGVNRVVLSAAMEVRPHYPTPQTPGSDSFDDFQVPYLPATVVQLPDLTDPIGNYQFPFITLGYVKINKKLTGKLK